MADNEWIAALRRLQRGLGEPITDAEQEEQMAEVARYNQWEEDTYGTAEDNYDGTP